MIVDENTPAANNINKEEEVGKAESPVAKKEQETPAAEVGDQPTENGNSGLAENQDKEKEANDDSMEVEATAKDGDAKEEVDEDKQEVDATDKEEDQDSEKKKDAEGESKEDGSEEEEEEEEEEEDEFPVEKIVKDDVNENGEKIYYIKWLGYPSSENTWEGKENLPEDLINAYEEQKAKKAAKTPRKRTAKGAPSRRRKSGSVVSNASDSEVEEEEKEEKPKSKTLANKRGGAKRGRKPSGTVADDDNAVPVDSKSWEDFVEYVETVQQREGKLTVMLRWKNGKRTIHPTSQVHYACPLKLIEFYEHHLTFKQVGDEGEAQDNGDAPNKKRKI